MSALPVVALALAVGIVIGAVIGFVVVPRIAERKRRIAAERAGLTVSQMLQRIVALSPMGVVVVDHHRDVVFSNSQAGDSAWWVIGCSTIGRGTPPGAP